VGVSYGLVAVLEPRGSDREAETAGSEEEEEEGEDEYLCMKNLTACTKATASSVPPAAWTKGEERRDESVVIDLKPAAAGCVSFTSARRGVGGMDVEGRSSVA
jgi:hypothetical protein